MNMLWQKRPLATFMKKIESKGQSGPHRPRSLSVPLIAFVVDNQMLLHSKKMYTCHPGRCAIKCLTGLPMAPRNIFSCDQAAIWLVQSVRPSVCPSHLFHHVPIIVSSWNFQELLPWSEVMSMQKVKVRGQRSRSQRSTPNLAVSGL